MIRSKKLFTMIVCATLLSSACPVRAGTGRTLAFWACLGSSAGLLWIGVKSKETDIVLVAGLATAATAFLGAYLQKHKNTSTGADKKKDYRRDHHDQFVDDLH